jgi:type III restriction enzyme
MKIKFDQNQDYQLDAINAVLDVFEGQPLAQGEQEISFEAAPGQLLTELGIANELLLSDDALLKNVQAVQERNEIAPIEKFAGRNFSIEMETGTGKTYVYLRTLFELQARYGWKKFIIVVPSVAIREGVLQTIEQTRDHFAAMYGNVPLDAWVYDSAQVSRLHGFATSNQMQLLIINIQAFDKKDIAVIHKERDNSFGYKPIEYIQAVRLRAPYRK